MVRIYNRTLQKRVYTLANGSTLRLLPHTESNPMGESLISTNLINEDLQRGVLKIISIKKSSGDEKTKGGTN